jgi:hypothetical protein
MNPGKRASRGRPFGPGRRPPSLSRDLTRVTNVSSQEVDKLRKEVEAADGTPKGPTIQPKEFWSRMGGGWIELSEKVEVQK